MAETMALEERIAKLEGRMDEHSRFVESVNIKLTNMERRFDDLDRKIDRFREELDRKIDIRFDSLSKRIDDLDKKMWINFRWIVGIQITTWITIILTILFKG